MCACHSVKQDAVYSECDGLFCKRMRCLIRLSVDCVSAWSRFFCLFLTFRSPCWEWDEQRAVKIKLISARTAVYTELLKMNMNHLFFHFVRMRHRARFSLRRRTRTSTENNPKLMMQHNINLMQSCCTVCKVQLARSKHNPQWM